MRKANLFPIFLVAAALAFGQSTTETVAQPASGTQETAASTDTATSGATDGTLASHHPRAEQVLKGDIELGYRFIQNINGDFNTYRSVVNLGEGPRVLHVDLSFAPPDQRLFNELRVQADNWGGDPYNTFRIDAEKTAIYRFHADYSNIQYFNFLPSFANPQVSQGVLVDQRSYDSFNRSSNFMLELFPSKRIIPYVAYSRNRGAGTGITPIVFDNNEFPIGNDLSTHSDDYRGGIRFEFSKWHLSVEQGGTTFKDDQGTYFLGENYGNRTTTYFNQYLYLTGASQAYRVRGRSMYSMVNGSATPYSWITLSGQFLFSQPKTDVDYSQVATGNLSMNNPFLFFSSIGGTAVGQAKAPHPSGNFTIELRPHSRLRILESVYTDRMHNATYGMATNLLYPGGITTTAALNDRLDVNYNRQQFDVLFDAFPFLTLRGGHRYEWGDSTVRHYGSGDALESAELKRNVALAGFVLRPFAGLSVTTDYERSEGDQVYFRTSLNDYHRLRAHARYQIKPSFFVGIGANFNQNENPTAGIALDQQYTAYSASFNWLPDSGKHISLIGEYTHSAFRSDLSYIAGPYYSTEYSHYRDNAHSATALLAITLPSIGVGTPHVDVGGSMFVSSGSRPTAYYQPIGRVSLPLQHWMSAFGEWRWYGMDQTFYGYERFRSHQFTAGVRWSL